jgi:hypothetical protein
MVSIGKVWTAKYDKTDPQSLNIQAVLLNDQKETSTMMMKSFQRFYPVFIGICVLGLGSLVNGDEGRQGPPKMDLTDEQQTCLEGKLGKPGEGERPTHEKMEAAFNSCGIARPDRAPAGEPPR